MSLKNTHCENIKLLKKKIKALKIQEKEYEDSILDLVECLKKQGQRMETRLWAYSSTIEQLGFKRNKIIGGYIKQNEK